MREVEGFLPSAGPGAGGGCGSASSTGHLVLPRPSRPHTGQSDDAGGAKGTLVCVPPTEASGMSTGEGDTLSARPAPAKPHIPLPEVGERDTTEQGGRTQGTPEASWHPRALEGAVSPGDREPRRGAPGSGRAPGGRGGGVPIGRGSPGERIWVTDQPEAPAARAGGLLEAEEGGGCQRRVRHLLLLLGGQVGRRVAAGGAAGAGAGILRRLLGGAAGRRGDGHPHLAAGRARQRLSALAISHGSGQDLRGKGRGSGAAAPPGGGAHPGTAPTSSRNKDGRWGSSRLPGRGRSRPPGKPSLSSPPFFHPPRGAPTIPFSGMEN